MYIITLIDNNDIIEQAVCKSSYQQALNTAMQYVWTKSLDYDTSFLSSYFEPNATLFDKDGEWSVSIRQIQY